MTANMDEAQRMAIDITTAIRDVQKLLRENGGYIAQAAHLAYEYAGDEPAGASYETGMIQQAHAAISDLENAYMRVRAMRRNLAKARVAAEEAEKQRQQARRRLGV